MTVGRWTYASVFMLAIFGFERIASSEPLSLLSATAVLVAVAMIWREGSPDRLVECGWLALIGGWICHSANASPISALTLFTALAMLVGGYRLRLPLSPHGAAID